MIVCIVIFGSLAMCLIVFLYAHQLGYRTGRYLSRDIIVGCHQCGAKSMLTYGRKPEGPVKYLFPMRSDWVFYLTPESLSFRCPLCRVKEES